MSYHVYGVAVKVTGEAFHIVVVGADPTGGVRVFVCAAFDGLPRATGCGEFPTEMFQYGPNVKARRVSHRTAPANRSRSSNVSTVIVTRPSPAPFCLVLVTTTGTVATPYFSS